MARAPFASWEPLPENSTQSAIKPTQFIIHTAVDHKLDIPAYFRRQDIKVESHFWLTRAGRLVQMMDTEIRADANYKANRRPDGSGAISVETEDDGDPEGIPWTPQQIRILVALVRWCGHAHDIPMRVCRTPSDPGIGWHSMWSYGDPVNLTGTARASQWTTALGKTCPGRTRIKQLVNDVLPMAFDGSDTSVPINSDSIETFQRAIVGMGGDPGPIDGKNGPKTRAGAHWAYDELGGEPHRPAADYDALEAQLTAARSQLGDAQQALLELRRQVDKWQALVGDDELETVVDNHVDMKALRTILGR